MTNETQINRFKNSINLVLPRGVLWANKKII